MTSGQENRRLSELEMRDHALSVIRRIRRVRHIVPRDPLLDLAANAAETLARLRGVTPPRLGVSSRRDVIYQPSLRPHDDYDHFLLEEQRWLESVTAGVTARYLPVLARALATELARGVRQSITSEALEQVVVALVRSRHPPESDRRRSVYDPTCGTASLLIAAAEATADKPLPVHGQDINPETVAIARAHAFLCDRPHQIAVANTLIEDAFTRQRFDLVVSYA